ncbi:MAG: hypothetical protein R6X10_17380 [Desulfobacterales bacterium]
MLNGCQRRQSGPPVQQFQFGKMPQCPVVVIQKSVILNEAPGSGACRVVQ